MQQIPLTWPVVESFDRADFIEAPPNAIALAQLENWPDGRQRAGVLIGDAGSGKSHLSHIWAQRTGARFLSPEHELAALGAAPYLVVEDIDRGGWKEDLLFHIYNWVGEQSGAVLFTSCSAPKHMDFALPDLASRLRACPVFELQPPDDSMMRMILAKLFADRQLEVDTSVIEYLITHAERSASFCRDIVQRVDESALAGRRRITLPLVRDILQHYIKSNYG